MEDIKMEENKVEDLLFVAVKQEPLDEDSLPECPIVKDELKHEETEITDVRHLEDENYDPVGHASKPISSNAFPQTHMVDVDSLPLQERIKEEMEDDPQDSDDENSTFTISCSLCNEVFKNETTLKIHQKAAHNLLFSCIICNEGFATAAEVNQHSKSVHNFSCCEYCLEHMGRYSCSFKGNPCNHDSDNKVTEAVS